ncbi:MAG: Ig-like domain-containing protein, partial [Deltaproteobacteria bacterium]|nr:Ig-like domain-containing protein [Deltaproteobacteria bacterium]
LSILPEDREEYISTDTDIMIEFNNPIDPQSVGMLTFFVWRGSSLSMVQGSYDLGYDDTVIYFTPDEALQTETTYYVVVDNIEDIYGSSLSKRHTSRFSTIEAEE